jgi:hypothetical protein
VRPEPRGVLLKLAITNPVQIPPTIAAVAMMPRKAVSSSKYR